VIVRLSFAVAALAALMFAPASWLAPGPGSGLGPVVPGPAPLAAQVPALAEMGDPAPSELADAVRRYGADRAALRRRYDVESPTRWDRQEAFFAEWGARLDGVDYDALGVEGRIDYQLLRNRLRADLQEVERIRTRAEEMDPLLPFDQAIVELHESRRDLERPDPRQAAAAMDRVIREATGVRDSLRAILRNGEGGLPTDPVTGLRAADRIRDLQRTLQSWFDHFDGYDPMFSWWVRAPYEEARETLKAYEQLLRRDVAGFRDGEEPIVGDPLGRHFLEMDVVNEMVAYTPEELIAIGERELAWGHARLREAAREMGYGDDWQAALEHVKSLHVDPGAQPDLVVYLAREAEEFLIERDLVTVPELAREIWRMEMLSPEWQRTAPFFLGGEVVRVAFPTDAMEHESKVMSLRSNNEHFSRAVVHHELIPGHHLQGFMTQRYSTHRSLFSTPFWGEGWALYWELLLWDLDFPRSPEDRIGMLVWRNHRAARIIFSINYHLGNWTPEECIEFLVENVGFERSAATAEVSRSFRGNYTPLYQAGYLLGGMQLRELHREMVESGRMSNRDFHDHILKSGRMPIEMVRASVRGDLLPRDFEARWRFAHGAGWER
jgi:uncharacterized protein (DUF885 family)